MKKATFTYTAPAGESKTLEVAGTTLLTGKSDTVICDDAMMARLVAAAATDGSMFKVTNVADYTPPKTQAAKEPEPEPPVEKEKPKGRS